MNGPMPTSKDLSSTYTWSIKTGKSQSPSSMPSSKVQSEVILLYREIALKFSVCKSTWKNWESSMKSHSKMVLSTPSKSSIPLTWSWYPKAWMSVFRKIKKTLKSGIMSDHAFIKEVFSLKNNFWESTCFNCQVMQQKNSTKTSRKVWPIWKYPSV